MEITGSIQPKKGYYYAVINSYINGKRKPKWLSTKIPCKGKNKHDERNNRLKAEMFLNDKLEYYQKIADGELNEIGNEEKLFSDFIDEWLAYKKETVELSTYEGYEIIAESQIKPYFAERQTLLCNIDTNEIQEFLNSKQKDGRRDNKGGLSRSTLKHFKNVFKQTLDYAIKQKLINSNPCDNIVLPKKSHSKPINFFTAPELMEFLSKIKGEPLYFLIMVASFYGLRRSEVLGLKWSAFDLDENLFTIQHTVVKIKTTEYKDSTKTESSHRSFTLLNCLKDAMLEEKAKQEEYKKLFGKEYYDSDYVFVWPNGKPFTPDYVTRKFKKLIKQYSNKDLHFHELRHSCASILLAMGATLSDVQQWLGHSDIETTVNIYGHLDMGHKKETAEKLAKKLNFESLFRD